MMRLLTRSLITLLFLSVLAILGLAGCSAFAHTNTVPTVQMTDASLAETTPTSACPITQPEWANPGDDPAVQNPMAYSYYYINEDRSIWGAAYWTDEAKDYLRAGKQGVKMGWFRPAGATLEITGQRLDGEAPPLEAEASCCYPTRFQASGLYFPTAGCWQITAKAAGKVLTFVVEVER